MNWEICVNWFVNNKDWLEIVIPAIAALPAVCVIIKYLYNIIIWFITLVFRIRNDESAKRAYQSFAKATESKVKTVKYEPLFFNEPEEKKYFFYKGIKIIDLYNKQKSISMKKLINRSYLIEGEAGSGKSAFLKNDFLKLRKKWYFRTRIAQWFLYSNELIDLLDNEEKQKSIIELISQAKYKKLFLYVDGIDEISEMRIGLFYKLINKLSSKMGKNFVLKLSSRPQFAANNISNQLSKYLINHVKVSDWNEKALLKYSKALLNHLRLKNHQTSKSDRDVYNNIKNSKMCKKYITSPLLMKLYIYSCIYGKLDDVENSIENKYNLYSSFVTTLIKVFWRRNGSPQSTEVTLKEQDEFAKQVFKSLSVPGKIIKNINNTSSLMPLCKAISDNNAVLIHETFYEYFVARNYYNCTTQNNMSMDSILVYCSNYSNDYADFITDAFKKDDIKDRKRNAQRFIEIYYFTLNSEGKNKYYDCKFQIPSYSLDLNKLNEHNYFSLKYELIFRLGRLYLEDELIVKFLEFIYYYDFNIRIQSDTEYYIAVLKRCCAISSSFVGGEKIEIDYVQHMLPYDKTNYDKNFDLANRTHTLVFYGDVTGSDIYTFKDDDPLQSCEKAMKKRMDRLSILLPKSIAVMDAKARKKYYFRLFDLATVYTFMVNRNIEMKQGDIEIICKCEVEFEGASSERTALMREIKEHILQF